MTLMRPPPATATGLGHAQAASPRLVIAIALELMQSQPGYNMAQIIFDHGCGCRNRHRRDLCRSNVRVGRRRHVNSDTRCARLRHLAAITQVIRRYSPPGSPAMWDPN